MFFKIKSLQAPGYGLLKQDTGILLIVSGAITKIFINVIISEKNLGLSEYNFSMYFVTLHNDIQNFKPEFWLTSIEITDVGFYNFAQLEY